MGSFQMELKLRPKAEFRTQKKVHQKDRVVLWSNSTMENDEFFVCSLIVILIIFYFYKYYLKL